MDSGKGKNTGAIKKMVTANPPKRSGRTMEMLKRIDKNATLSAELSEMDSSSLNRSTGVPAVDDLNQKSETDWATKGSDESSGIPDEGFEFAPDSDPASSSQMGLRYLTALQVIPDIKKHDPSRSVLKEPGKGKAGLPSQNRNVPEWAKKMSQEEDSLNLECEGVVGGIDVDEAGFTFMIESDDRELIVRDLMNQAARYRNVVEGMGVAFIPFEFKVKKHLGLRSETVPDHKRTEPLRPKAESVLVKKPVQDLSPDSQIEHDKKMDQIQSFLAAMELGFELSSYDGKGKFLLSSQIKEFDQASLRLMLGQMEVLNLDHAEILVSILKKKGLYLKLVGKYNFANIKLKK